MSELRLVTASGELEVCAETRAQLVRRLGSLRRGHAVQRVLSEAGTARPVELDGDGKRQLLAELSFWLDNPGPGGFPDDARALYRALAGELEPVADGDVPVLGS